MLPCSLNRPAAVRALAIAFALAIASIVPAAQAKGPGAFTPTGSMTTIRYFATATLLLNGKVLVAGGNSSSGALASAELYDPSTGKFTPTGSMGTGRYNGTATLLADGKVLMAGGYGATDVLSSAEIYDPSTGKFTPTSSMSVPREFATATRLPDGTVLVAGGGNSSGSLASAEKYDPSSGLFTSLGPGHEMGVARNFATATPVAGGKVLIAGGSGPGGEHDTAEVFDPTTDLFLPTSGNLGAPRMSAGASPLNDGGALIAGGYSISNFVGTAVTYDPITRKFSAVGSLSVPREYVMMALLLDGRVLATGGWNYSTVGAVASAEVFDPATKRFVATGRMGSPRAWGTATRLDNGKVLVTGGWNGFFGLSSAELYDPNGTDKPAKPIVRWTVSQGKHSVTATVLRQAATTYKYTAKQGKTTKTGTCSSRSVNVVCKLTPGGGRWVFSVTPHNAAGDGPPNIRVFTLASAAFAG